MVPWWRFSRVNTVHVNNYGFVNNQDYDPAADAPLVAVIGDSYVEAAMIPFDETLQGRLSRKLGGHGRVYSFGIAGTSFATYLGWAEYARDTFGPEAAVFVIVGNDFLGALCKYAQDFYCFEEVDGQQRTCRTTANGIGAGDGLSIRLWQSICTQTSRSSVGFESSGAVGGPRTSAKHPA